MLQLACVAAVVHTEPAAQTWAVVEPEGQYWLALQAVHVWLALVAEKEPASQRLQAALEGLKEPATQTLHAVACTVEA
jgi:hypothetical protein